VRALTKPVPRVLVRAQQQRDAARNWRQVTAEVKKRDGGKCRVCGKPGSQAHHIVYRSHGGPDTAANLVWTCLDCHRRIHAKVILVTFDPDSPAQTIRFERNPAWDAESAR
jgi:5-methylcytosine-specific restriction endonuclease McrA